MAPVGHEFIVGLASIGEPRRDIFRAGPPDFGVAVGLPFCRSSVTPNVLGLFPDRRFFSRLALSTTGSAELRANKRERTEPEGGDVSVRPLHMPQVLT